MRAILALAGLDLKLALRQRAVLFFNYLFPLGVFLALAETMRAGHGRRAMPLVVSMVFVLGALGNGLFGAGMRAVQEREAGILRRYKVAPIGPLPLLVASLVTGSIVFVPAAALTLALACVFYGMPFPPHPLSLAVLLTLGALAFRALGLVVAAVANSTSEAHLIIQLFYMPLLLASGAMVPLALFPDWLRTVAQFLPSAYLATGLQGILIRGESLAASSWTVLALALTTVVATFLATRLFRWEKEERIRPAAKLWVLVVLLPFLVLGAVEARRQGLARKADGLWRDVQRPAAASGEVP